MAHACDVVIPTRNRPDRLRMCLRALLEQSVRDVRVIVVDDHGDLPLDAVIDEAEAAGLDVVLVRMPERSGPAAARNAGVRLVDAERVVFIDDDVRADWRLLEAHLDAARTGGGPPVVTCGPFVEPADREPTAWNRWEAVMAKKEADNLCTGRYAVSWRQCHTGNNCIPVAAFRAAGGFDESFTRAEDDELAYRLHVQGCQIVFVPSAIAWHYSHRPLDSWLAIPRAYAVHDVRLDRLHPEVGHLARRERELRARRLPMRVARAVFLLPGMPRVGTAVWVRLGVALHRLGLGRASVSALSAAYDLSYSDALRDAARADILPVGSAVRRSRLGGRGRVTC